jgi:membrane protease YdiL (CAAX protease family)
MSGDSVVIYRARDLPEAHGLRLALESENISARVDIKLQSGELGVAGNGPRVLVGSTDAAAAGMILDRFLKRKDDATPRDDTIVRCLACRKPMGQADVCPACGWSYRCESDTPSDTSPEQTGPAEEEAPAPDSDNLLCPPVLPRRTVWAEVAAVLAVSVVPYCLGAVSMLAYALPPEPYWLHAVHLIGLNCCTIFVTLYLIYRSGEPWSRFGLTRPRLSDVLIGVGLLLVAEALWVFCFRRIRTDSGPTDDPFPRALLAGDYILMVVMFATGGFAEELVSRAYLITRFEQLLRSRGRAVLLSAILFAAYHAYQGGLGVAYTLVFGAAYGVVFLMTRRVWPLAIGHALYNIRLELIV